MSSPKVPARPGIDAELAALQATYGATVTEKIEALAATLQRARDGDHQSLETAITAAHRIRGTAGSYGFDTLGRCAGELEEALLELASDAPTPSWRGIGTIVSRMRRIADSVGANPRPSPPAVERSVVSFLVVDDDAHLLDLLQTESIGLPLELHTATTAEDALRVASSTIIDGAVIDVHLDRPSFGLAHQLRATTGNDYLPIAFLSGDKSLESRVHAAHAGAVAYIDKPIDPADFLAALEHMVRATRRGRDCILIVDDDEDFIASTEAILHRNGYDVIGLQRADLIVSTLEDREPAALLIDMHMPRFTGAEVCAVLRASDRWRELPILVATARTDLASRIQAFEAGADDYLLKPLIEAELLARLRHRLDRARLVRERVDTDPHSGLLRRQAFLERLAAILSGARRKGRIATLCLIDLDRFKAVNDTHGHLAGDDVIAGFGRLLRSRFRREDARGRWGGEEFIAAFGEEDAETMGAAIRRILDEFGKVSFEGRNGPFHVTFSAGMAEFPADGHDARELIAAADRRLYIAKAGGRAQVVTQG